MQLETRRQQRCRRSRARASAQQKILGILAVGRAVGRAVTRCSRSSRVRRHSNPGRALSTLPAVGPAGGGGDGAVAASLRAGGADRGVPAGLECGSDRWATRPNSSRQRSDPQKNRRRDKISSPVGPSEPSDSCLNHPPSEALPWLGPRQPVGPAARQRKKAGKNASGSQGRLDTLLLGAGSCRALPGVARRDSGAARRMTLKGVCVRGRNATHFSRSRSGKIGAWGCGGRVA